jgi:TetR/AcrR family transcriptional regulator, cholesterol catabolism regulator
MAEKKLAGPSADTYGLRQLKSLARRRQVLAAANRCFSRHGFGKTSIQLVAREAGVSKALVFAFFGHKDALYDAVIEQTLITWTGFAEHEAARFHDRPELELASMFRGSFEFAAHSPMLRVLMSRRDRELQEKLSSLPRIVRDWRRRFADVLQRGITQKVFRTDLDPHLASLVIHDVQHLYLDQMVAGQKGDYDAKRMEQALQLLLAGLRPPANSSQSKGKARGARRDPKQAKSRAGRLARS